MHEPAGALTACGHQRIDRLRSPVKMAMRSPRASSDKAFAGESQHASDPVTVHRVKPAWLSFHCGRGQVNAPGKCAPTAIRGRRKTSRAFVAAASFRAAQRIEMASAKTERPAEASFPAGLPRTRT